MSAFTGSGDSGQSFSQVNPFSDASTTGGQTTTSTTGTNAAPDISYGTSQSGQSSAPAQSGYTSTPPPTTTGPTSTPSYSNLYGLPPYSQGPPPPGTTITPPAPPPGYQAPISGTYGSGPLGIGYYTQQGNGQWTFQVGPGPGGGIQSFAMSQPIALTGNPFAPGATQQSLETMVNGPYGSTPQIWQAPWYSSPTPPAPGGPVTNAPPAQPPQYGAPLPSGDQGGQTTGTMQPVYFGSTPVNSQGLYQAFHSTSAQMGSGWNVSTAQSIGQSYGLPPQVIQNLWTIAGQAAAAGQNINDPNAFDGYLNQAIQQYQQQGGTLPSGNPQPLPATPYAWNAVAPGTPPGTTTPAGQPAPTATTSLSTDVTNQPPAPYQSALISGYAMPPVVGNQTMGIPNVQSWNSLSPSEQQATYQAAQALGINPDQFGQALQMFAPEFAYTGPAPYQSY